VKRSEDRPAMNLRDQRLVEATRAAMPEGLPIAEAYQVADARFLLRCFARCKANGYVFGESVDERLILVIDPEQSAQSQEPTGVLDPDIPVRERVGSLSESAQDLEGRLFELAPVQHFDVKAEAA
jgi:hypothetical protein